MGFHAQHLELFDVIILDRMRCVFGPNIPEKALFRESRWAAVTENRGWQSVAGRRPSIIFGKVCRNALLSGHNRGGEPEPD
jgi:hypothetical protein